MGWRDAPVYKREEIDESAAWRNAPKVSGAGAGADIDRMRVEAGRVPMESLGMAASEINQAKREAEQERVLGIARGALGKAPFPTVRGGTLALGAGFLSQVARGSGFLSRAVGQKGDAKIREEQADFWARYAKSLLQVAGERAEEPGHIIPPIVKRGLAGALASGGDAAIAGPLGMYGIAVKAAMSEANSAWTEGKDAGLKGKELRNFAVRQGVIDGSITVAMNRFGLGGFEKVAGSAASIRGGIKQVVKQGKTYRRIAKEAAKDFRNEEIEELTIGVLQRLNSKYSGVDESEITPESLFSDAAETTSQVAWMMFGAGAPKAAVQVRESKRLKIEDEIIVSSKSEDAPTRAQWKKWGLKPEDGRSYKARREGVKKRAEQIKAKAKALTEIQETAQAIQEGVPVSEEIAPQPAEAVKAALEASVVEGEVVPTYDPSAPAMPVEQREFAWEEEGPVPKQEGEVASFIKGPGGKIGISVKALTRGISFTKHAMRRFFTAPGELPQSVFDLRIKRDGQIASNNREMALKLNDYNKAMKVEYSGRDLTQRETWAYDGAIKGEVPLESLPGNLGKLVGIMRNHIDSLSQRGIEIGAFQGKMEGTIMKNKGIWIHRSYKVHDGPEWAQVVPDEIRNAAIAQFRGEYPGKSEAEIQGLIAKLLFKGTAADTPIAQIRESTLGSKDLSILKRRGDLSPEIRALLGEYRDIRINYAKSACKLGTVIANHEFLKGVREAGTGIFLSETPIVNDFGELKVPIAADESSAMFPLNGMYTTPEVRDAFTRALDKRGSMPSWVRFALGANAIVKLNKTVISLMCHVRNFNAGPFFALNQGHWRVGKTYTAFKATWTNLAKKNDPEWRAYVLDAIEHNVIGQGVKGKELRAHVQDSVKYDIDDYALMLEKRRARKTNKLARAGLDLTEELYLAEDDFWKLYGWENEKADYRIAQPDLPESEIKTKCARIINNVYPTWSHISEMIKNLRLFPAVGAFVSFNAEMIRNQYHTLNYAQQELRDPQLRKIGARRLAGFTANLAAIKGAEIAARMLAGISADDDDDLRWFVAPWQENSIFLHLGKLPGKAGEAIYRFVDLTYNNPHTFMVTPFEAFARGGDLKEGLWSALKDIMEPFVGEEILAGKVVNVWSNNDSGKRVYNPQDSVNRQAADVITHLWSAFEPGIITSVRKAKKGYEKSITRGNMEVLATITGQRIQTLDVGDSLKWRVRDFSRNIRDANIILSRALTKKEHLSEKELRSAYGRADSARRGSYEKMSKIAKAAIRRGIPPDHTATILVTNGVAKLDIDSVMAGVYNKRRITPAQLKAMYQANPAEFEARKAILIDLLEETPETLR